MSANLSAAGGAGALAGGSGSAAPVGDVNRHRRQQGNARGAANGVGRNGRRKRGDDANGRPSPSRAPRGPVEEQEQEDEDEENFDDISAMLLLMSPGASNLAKRRHCEPPSGAGDRRRDGDGASASGGPASEEDEEDAPSRRSVASPAEEDDGGGRRAAPAEERAEAVTSLVFAPPEKGEEEGGRARPAAPLPDREAAPERLPWSHLHHLLEQTAAAYGNNVAYRIGRPAGAGDEEEGEADAGADGENLVGNFERFALGGPAMDEGEDSDDESGGRSSSVGSDGPRGEGPSAEASPQSNSDGGSSGRSSDPTSMAASSSAGADEALPRRGAEPRASPRRVVHHGGDYGSDQRQGVDVTYRKVQERVSKIAGALRALGVRRADRVGIMLPNCPEYFGTAVAAPTRSARAAPARDDAGLTLGTPRATATTELYFAISAASAISVQLNPRLAAPELRGVLRDSECRFVFTASEPELLALLIDVGLAEHTLVRGVVWVNSIGGWVAPDAPAGDASPLDASDDGLAGISSGRGWLNRNGVFGEVAQLSYDEIAAFSMERWEAPGRAAGAAGAAAAGPAEPAPPVDDEEGSVATLFYTSGTTGVPKGVMLTHANVLYHALRTRETLGWARPPAARPGAAAPSIVWGHFAPMFHVGDAWAVFAAAEVGGRHVFIPRFEINHILRLIEAESVEYTKIVPTMLHLIAHSPQLRSTDASSLRMIVSGGAPLHVDVVARAMRSLDCDLLQDYGMTECCCHITLGDPAEEAALPQDEKLRRKVKAGKVFRGMQVRVVDPEWEAADGADPPPLGVDEVGELWVRGDNLFIGYWRRPEETAKVMHRGWFRTGDLGSIDGNGYVSVSDRKKDMIISGGENIFSIGTRATTFPPRPEHRTHAARASRLQLTENTRASPALASYRGGDRAPRPPERLRRGGVRRPARPPRRARAGRGDAEFARVRRARGAADRGAQGALREVARAVQGPARHQRRRRLPPRAHGEDPEAHPPQAGAGEVSRPI